MKDTLNNPLMNALRIESRVAEIMGRQALNGVQFDSIRAGFYIHVLTERINDLYRKIRPSLRIDVIRYEPYNVCLEDGSGPFTSAGKPIAYIQKWFDNTGGRIEELGGKFSRVWFEEPDLGKRERLIDQLLELGWQPREFTPKTEKGGGGNPRITVDGEVCPSLLEISSHLGKDIAMWYTLSHRRSQLVGLLKVVEEDGRIPAEAHTIGTPTYRMRHSKVVNIPKVSMSYDEEYITWFWPKGKPSQNVVFGKQMRSLFTVKGPDIHNRINGRAEHEGISSYPLYLHREYKMGGHDASGLELRGLAHYINDEEYTYEVAEGDAHRANQRKAGLPTRDDAKTFIYAFIYGAGNGKLGSIIGGGVAQGKAIRERFLNSMPGLRALIDGIQRAAAKGWVKALDGRRLRIRRDNVSKKPQIHKAPNAVIQSAGAIIMKYSMVWLDQAVKTEGLDVKKVIDMHDEAQAEVSSEDAPRYAWLAEESVRAAGRFLNVRCPLDAEAKVDYRWSKTH